MREINRVPLSLEFKRAMAAKRDRLGIDLIAELAGVSHGFLQECCAPTSCRNMIYVSTLDKLVTRLGMDANYLYEAEREAKRLLEEKEELLCRNV